MAPVGGIADLGEAGAAGGEVGGIEVRRSGDGALATISNPATTSAGIGATVSEATTAAAGRSARRRATKASRAAGEPKASMVTPAASLRTRPAIPISRATR